MSTLSQKENPTATAALPAANDIDLGKSSFWTNTLVGRTIVGLCRPASSLAVPLAIAMLAGCKQSGQVIYERPTRGGPDIGRVVPVPRPLSESDAAIKTARSIGIPSGLYISTSGQVHNFAESGGMELITGNRGSWTAQVRTGTGAFVTVDMYKLDEWSKGVQDTLRAKNIQGAIVDMNGDVRSRTGEDLKLNVGACPTIHSAHYRGATSITTMADLPKEQRDWITERFGSNFGFTQRVSLGAATTTRSMYVSMQMADPLDGAREIMESALKVRKTYVLDAITNGKKKEEVGAAFDDALKLLPKGSKSEIASSYKKLGESLAELLKDERSFDSKKAAKIREWQKQIVSTSERLSDPPH